MMIDVTLCQINVRPEVGKSGLETFRSSNRAQRTDERIAQSLKRQLFTGKNILQIKRFVRTFDDFGGAIITTDASHQLEIGLAGIFGNKDVAGAAKTALCLTQCPSRE